MIITLSTKNIPYPASHVLVCKDISAQYGTTIPPLSQRKGPVTFWAWCSSTSCYFELVHDTPRCKIQGPRPRVSFSHFWQAWICLNHRLRFRIGQQHVMIPWAQRLSLPTKFPPWEYHLPLPQMLLNPPTPATGSVPINEPTTLVGAITRPYFYQTRRNNQQSSLGLTAQDQGASGAGITASSNHPIATVWCCGAEATKPSS